MAQPIRIQKIEELIKRELGVIIRKEVDFKKENFLTITRVKANRTLQAARVFITAFPPSMEANALNILNRNVFRIQSILNRKLPIRPVPKIHFFIDVVEEDAQNIESILTNIKIDEHE